MPATVAAPADVDELCSDYLPYVRHLVRKLGGISAQDAEDVAHDILARLIERDVIGMFDPEHEITHGGKKIPPNFKTFLSNQVALYVKGQRDRLGRISRREPLLCDRPEDGGGTWVEVFSGQQDERDQHKLWDDYSHLNAEEFVTRMRAYLTTLPPRSKRDRCNLLALFDALVSQGLTEGKVDYARVQQEFEISPTSAYTWVARLRDVLKAAPTGKPQAGMVWKVGGVALTEADIAQAIEILSSKAGGIMVRQPLAKAGHKLMAAEDPNWYHPFSEHERKLFPELEIDPATHKKPAGHVRKAVVHRLQRMLAEVAGPGPAAEAEPVVDTPEDLLEAELWKLGADMAAVDKIKELAQAAYS